MNAHEYIENLPDERKEPMQKVREMIARVFPEINESMTYKMPTYELEGEIFCALASQKNYMALYIMPYDLLDHFKEELKSYNCGKSCIRFKKLGDEDLELFEKIVEYTGNHYPESDFYGRIKR